MTTSLYIKDESTKKIYLVGDGLVTSSQDGYIYNQNEEKALKISEDIGLIFSGKVANAMYFCEALENKMLIPSHSIYLDLKDISKNITNNSEIILFFKGAIFEIWENNVDILNSNNHYAIGAGANYANALIAYFNEYEPQLPILDRIDRIYKLISSITTSTNKNYSIIEFDI